LLIGAWCGTYLVTCLVVGIIPKRVNRRIIILLGQFFMISGVFVIGPIGSVNLEVMVIGLLLMGLSGGFIYLPIIP